ncbi:MAG: hypothetical protein IKH14_00390 [Prevotella sp.]|nr:hypothetical protein [Prevotella sp.]
MKAKVEIAQKTTYRDYKGEISDYTDTLKFEFGSLEEAKSLVDAFPGREIEDIEVIMTVTLKDRNEFEDGEEQ